MIGIQLSDERGGINFGKIDSSQSIRDGINVRLLASALNHRDVWIIKGKYPGIRKGVVLGSDGAGELDGRNVLINPGMKWGSTEAFQATDFNILGMPFNGTFASNCFVPHSHIHNIPSHLSISEAAALPLAGVTAYRALMVKGGASKSSKIFINGLGGGVALLACQMALSLGCEVYGSSGSKWKSEKAEAIGVSRVFNYNDDGWVKKFIETIGGVDVIIDSAGGHSFSDLLKITNPGAKIITYGGTLGKIDSLSPQLIFWKQLSILGSTMGSEKDFKDMLDFVSEHKLHPIIDEIIPLSEAERGFKKMGNREQFGKIVFEHDL